MKEPFSSGYFTPLFITDQIQKRSHNACCKNTLYARYSQMEPYMDMEPNAPTKLWNSPDKVYRSRNISNTVYPME